MLVSARTSINRIIVKHRNGACIGASTRGHKICIKMQIFWDTESITKWTRSDFNSSNLIIWYCNTASHDSKYQYDQTWTEFVQLPEGNRHFINFLQGICFHFRSLLFKAQENNVKKPNRWNANMKYWQSIHLIFPEHGPTPKQRERRVSSIMNTPPKLHRKWGTR